MLTTTLSKHKISLRLLVSFIIFTATAALAEGPQVITPPQQQKIIPSISEIPSLPSIKLSPPSVYKDIFQFDKTPAIFSPRRSSDVIFYEDASDIILASAYYKLAIDKKNGGIKYIEDLKAGDKVSSGTLNSALWKLDFHGGKNLKNNQFSGDSRNKVFYYKWEEPILKLSYEEEELKVKVEIRIITKRSNYFDIETAITNNYDKPIIAFTLPYNISFSISKLNRFIYPSQLGIALKPGFFSSRRAIFENNYIFSDYVCWESTAGNLSIYTIQEDDGIWTQPEYSIGYNSAFWGVGIYSYKLQTYVTKGQKWTSPKIRFRVGESALESIFYYSKDNKMGGYKFGGYKSLKDKLGEKFFDAVSGSVLLKLDFRWIDRSFKGVKEFLKTLPSPTLVHLVSFWPKGFDQNYPDYLPPEKKFGSQQDLRDLVDAAHKDGLLVMPYTNPTWWNESPTLAKLGKENIAVRKLNGTLSEEAYWNNQNWGYAVSLHHPDVVARTKQTLEEFTKDIPCDILFEDQLGARSGQYDLNPKAKSPVAYKQGLIDTARQGSKKIPIMVEAGFDGLMPYTVGFCGVTVNDTLPPDASYDRRFGEGNWEIFPMALYIAHDKVAFYHHNLAHEVFVDNKEKLTWSLAYGYNLYQGYWPNDWDKSQKKWFYILDALQKKVASRYFGKRLTDYQTLEDKVTLSKFEDIGIVANRSKKNTFEVDSNIIAKSGFMAKSEDDSLIAGLFAGFNDDRLAGEHFLIIEKRDNSYCIQQPDPKNTLISMKRPYDWLNDDYIHAYFNGKEIPLAVTPLKATFFYDTKNADGNYCVKYEEKSKSDVEVLFQLPSQGVLPGEEVNITAIAQNKTSREIKNAKIALTTWLVKPSGPAPDINAGYPGDKRNPSLVSEEFSLKPQRQARAEFRIKSPDKVENGDILWIKAEVIDFESGMRMIKQAQTRLNILPQPIEVHIEPQTAVILAGESKEFKISVRNNFSKAKEMSLAVETDIPQELVEISPTKINVDANAQKNLKLTVKPTPNEAGRKFKLLVKISSEDRSVESGPSLFFVESPITRIDIGPTNILTKDKEEKIEVAVEAVDSYKAKGEVRLKVPSGWKISPESQTCDFENDNKQKLNFLVTPTAIGKAEISAQISVNGLTQETSEPFIAIEKNRCGVIEADINQDKETDLILGNGLIEVQTTTVIGGRILAFYLRESGNNLLYTAYPNVKRISDNNIWAEYGGINDWFPEGWPGDVWNSTWEYKILEDNSQSVAVEMATKSQNGLILKRIMRLNADSSELAVKYTVSNPTDKKQKFTWVNHPDLAPGPLDATDDDLIIIPTQKELVEKEFGESLSKFEYIPSKGWCLTQNKTTGEYFAQRFELKLIDKVGVWEGVGFFTMELIFKPVEIEPNQEINFEVTYVVGKGEWRERLR